MRQSAWSDRSTRIIRKVFVFFDHLPVAKPSRTERAGSLAQKAVHRAGTRRQAQSPLGERKLLLEPQNKDQNKRMTVGWKPSHPGTWVIGGRSEKNELGGLQMMPLPMLPAASLQLAHMAKLVQKHLPWGKQQVPVSRHHLKCDMEVSRTTRGSF